MPRRAATGPIKGPPPEPVRYPSERPRCAYSGSMRIWSLHPRLLDGKGLVACWRETLLAQKVLAGETKGYRNHPQLQRFRATADQMAAIGAYLCGLDAEALNRGYSFNTSLILVQPRL